MFLKKLRPGDWIVTSQYEALEREFVFVEGLLLSTTPESGAYPVLSDRSGKIVMVRRPAIVNKRFTSEAQ